MCLPTLVDVTDVLMFDAAFPGVERLSFLVLDLPLVGLSLDWRLDVQLLDKDRPRRDSCRFS